MTPPWLRPNNEGVAIAIKVQPRASLSQLIGPHGNEFKVRITAPPVDSAANEALLALIAETLGCRRQMVTLLRGAASRSKVVFVRGGNAEEIEAKFMLSSTK